MRRALEYLLHCVLAAIYDYFPLHLRWCAGKIYLFILMHYRHRGQHTGEYLCAYLRSLLFFHFASAITNLKFDGWCRRRLHIFSKWHYQARDNIFSLSRGKMLSFYLMPADYRLYVWPFIMPTFIWASSLFKLLSSASRDIKLWWEIHADYYLFRVILLARRIISAVPNFTFRIALFHYHIEYIAEVQKCSSRVPHANTPAPRASSPLYWAIQYEAPAVEWLFRCQFFPCNLI